MRTYLFENDKGLAVINADSREEAFELLKRHDEGRDLLDNAEEVTDSNWEEIKLLKHTAKGVLSVSVPGRKAEVVKLEVTEVFEARYDRMREEFGVVSKSAGFFLSEGSAENAARKAADRDSCYTNPHTRTHDALKKENSYFLLEHTSYSHPFSPIVIIAEKKKSSFEAGQFFSVSKKDGELHLSPITEKEAFEIAAPNRIAFKVREGYLIATKKVKPK